MKMTWSGWQMKKISLLLKQFYNKKIRSKIPKRGKLIHSSEMQNDTFMQREGLKG